MLQDSASIPAPPLPYHTAPDGTQVFPPRLLTDIIDKAVTHWPDRVAIDYFGRLWTFGEIG